MKPLSVTIQMKATEQYFPVVLFIMLCKMVLTVEGGDEGAGRINYHAQKSRANKLTPC